MGTEEEEEEEYKEEEVMLDRSHDLRVRRRLVEGFWLQGRQMANLQRSQRCFPIPRHKRSVSPDNRQTAGRQPAYGLCAGCPHLAVSSCRLASRAIRRPPK